MKKMQLDSSLINKSATDIFKSSNAKTGTVKPSKPSKPKNLLNNFFSKYRNLPAGKKILVTIIYCVAIVAIGGGATYLVIIYSESGPDLKIPSQVSASETDKSTFTATISSPMPLPPRDNLNPINGELYTAKEFSEIKSKYPIAVVIENHVDARPQSGYNSADLVFETLAEGGITRTLAIFWGKDCPEMGPIRSARQYFLEWLVPFDPVFMFIGYAYSDSGDLRVDSGANMVSYGIKRLDTAGSFWR
ncbi:MAG: DUF3048 domain-containing protein, partial [Patescibacteria group bacterium]|nr:DUF3048 domain-containing protein [Patescibacteria group bacterium]